LSGAAKPWGDVRMAFIGIFIGLARTFTANKNLFGVMVNFVIFGRPLTILNVGRRSGKTQYFVHALLRGIQQ
jgi:hypothetical protein